MTCISNERWDPRYAIQVSSLSSYHITSFNDCWKTQDAIRDVQVSPKKVHTQVKSKQNISSICMYVYVRECVRFWKIFSFESVLRVSSSETLCTFVRKKNFDHKPCFVFFSLERRAREFKFEAFTSSTSLASLAYDKQHTYTYMWNSRYVQKCTSLVLIQVCECEIVAYTNKFCAKRTMSKWIEQMPPKLTHTHTYTKRCYYM